MLPRNAKQAPFGARLDTGTLHFIADKLLRGLSCPQYNTSSLWESIDLDDLALFSYDQQASYVTLGQGLSHDERNNDRIGQASPATINHYRPSLVFCLTKGVAKLLQATDLGLLISQFRPKKRTSGDFCL